MGSTSYINTQVTDKCISAMSFQNFITTSKVNLINKKKEKTSKDSHGYTTPHVNPVLFFYLGEKKIHLTFHPLIWKSRIMLPCDILLPNTKAILFYLAVF